MPRYTLCPYFQHELGARITCEDVYRRFDSESQKSEWMDMYCDTDWMSCPYAKALNKAYERLEKGDEMAIEDHKIEALETELKSMATKLGKCQHRINAKIEEIKELRKKNKRLEDLRKKEYALRRKAENELEDYQKHESVRYFKMAAIYEDRLAYLIDTYCEGRLPEVTVKEWAKDKEYALTFDEKEQDPVWVVMTRDAEQTEQTDCPWT